MEKKDIIATIALVISFVSLLWTYMASRKIEKYKAIIGLEKNYVESRLNEDLNLIRELIEGIRNGRLLIEKVVDRQTSVTTEALNKTLDDLERTYTNALLFLEKTHARIGHSAMVIFTHELKNKIRNSLEHIASTDVTNDTNLRTKLKETLDAIKNEEAMLVEKLSDINSSLFEVYKNTMKK